MSQNAKTNTTNYVVSSCCSFAAKPVSHQSVPDHFSVNCIISDIDECRTGEHSCQQLCNNLPGTYNCSCDTGFMLNNDSRNCTGRILGRMTFYDHVSCIIHCISIIKSINCQNINRSKYVVIAKHCNLKAARRRASRSGL